MTRTLRTSAALNAPGEIWEGPWGHETICIVEDIHPAMDKVVAAMTAAGYAREDIFAVRLSLEEVVVNGIKHGHQHDPTKQVQLSYRVTPEQVVLVIEDEGPGFCPEDVPNPLDPENVERTCGRGVFLVRHYMTWVQYNERGNCVTMCKRRCATD
ncbi:MAG TPA: ATP-binding protein [Gemmataceae bacterium]|nr:ATP-binding protein [Gemmataceae bacterium]